MKVLVAHSRYQQPGGEETTLENEAALLERHGHRVVRHIADNRDLAEMSRPKIAISTLWNRQTSHAIRALIDRERPDVVQVHNWFPLLSPSVHHAARAGGVPVVQTWQNYRLACVNAMLLRDGAVCEDCVGRPFAWPGIRHACYRGSRVQSAGVAVTVTGHRLIGTWSRSITEHIAPSDIVKRHLITSGVPADRIHLKPNFLAEDPGPGTGSGDHLMFVGRLAPEKGVDILLDAWAIVRPRARLLIVGDGPPGPVRDAVAAAHEVGDVTWLGWQPEEAVIDLLGSAQGLVVPSIWYEGQPRVILESLARGTPVLTSRLGAMAEMIEDRRTGRLAEPGSAGSLAEAIRWLLEHPDHGSLRDAARATFETSHASGPNLTRLLEIYELAIARHASRSAERCS